MIASLWRLAELHGGETTAIGHTLALYPVASAVISDVLVYLFAVRVTWDRRIGTAALLVLTFIAGHAFQTSLGFADHHGFNYPWLALLALALVALLTLSREVGGLRQPLSWVA